MNNCKIKAYLSSPYLWRTNFYEARLCNEWNMKYLTYYVLNNVVEKYDHNEDDNEYSDIEEEKEDRDKNVSFQ